MQPRISEPAISSRLPANVIALGAVSFLTDAATEMIYPLVPIFLSGVLGASARFIGVIEGTAETVAAVLKLVTGRISDRMDRRKPLVVLGYSVASLARPLVAIAQTAGQVLAVRLADRVGKGIRTAPRDALLADSVPLALRGRAYGFHRAADHAGAVVGPLVAFVLLWALTGSWTTSDAAASAHTLRTVFGLAIIPGVLALIALLFFVREERRTVSAGQAAARTARPGRPFAVYLAAVLLFTLGNSTDAFLLLRAEQLGVAVALAPVLWSALHVVKSAGATYGGALSDRFGRRPVIIAGWLLYAGVYAGFALADAAWHAWALFALYGVYFALTEGPERALVADLVSEHARGVAFGWYNLVVGIGALPASLLFGAIWDGWGAPMAFAVGAAIAALACLVLAAARLPVVQVSSLRAADAGSD
jgi:MFS family permease